MMKKIITGSLVCLLLFSVNLYAGNVRVFFSNNTDKNFHPLAEISYKENGIEYEDKLIEPPVSVITANAQNVPLDKLRTTDDHYHYTQACLDSYLAITGDADIHFFLDKDEGGYQCHYKVNRY
jgi:hypothetical protein